MRKQTTGVCREQRKSGFLSCSLRTLALKTSPSPSAAPPVQHWVPSAGNSPSAAVPRPVPQFFEPSRAIPFDSHSGTPHQASSVRVCSFPVCDLLALELLDQVPQAPLLVLQALTLAHHTLQLLPQVADEVLKHGLQVSPGCWQHILLQQLPLGGQHLVLLLQQPHLGRERMAESGSPVPAFLHFPEGKVKIKSELQMLRCCCLRGLNGTSIFSELNWSHPGLESQAEQHQSLYSVSRPALGSTNAGSARHLPSSPRTGSSASRWAQGSTSSFSALKAPHRASFGCI